MRFDPYYCLALLWQAAEQRRVVLLVDALDQFEATPRGRFATWLPRMWPPNARFIATAIPGDASEALRRAGIGEIALAPLEAAEARDIVSGICRRYHRRFEPEVIEALLAKTGERQFAFANPLWLVLAVEELNLLDEDDFSRAQRAYTGLPAQRLRALMLDLIADLPADTPGLYRTTFDRAPALFSASYTGAWRLPSACSGIGTHRAYPAARFWTEHVDERFAKVGTYEIYCVVCNLVNGLPPRYRDEPPERR